jgi:hypothetical protein
MAAQRLLGVHMLTKVKQIPTDDKGLMVVNTKKRI